MNINSNRRATEAARARYERIAPNYDWLEGPREGPYRSWRRRFWDQVGKRLRPNGHLLEIGVGTGKNMPCWLHDAKITAIDFSPRMIEQAMKRARGLAIDVRMGLADAQDLPYPDDLFDIAAITFVMCSVPDPVLGLQEVVRVVKPWGNVLMMEHVRSPLPWIGKLMDYLDPFVLRAMGSHINRNTVETAEQADLDVIEIENLGLGGIFLIIHARVPPSRAHYAI